MVGIDGSEESMRAVNRAMEIQRDFGGEVVVFHSVLHKASNAEDNEDDKKKILEKVEALFKEKNQSVETRLIFETLPEDYIKNVVEDEGFNLVVLGSKGKHKGLKRTILGSVPSKVTNNVLCDILVIR